MTEPEHVSELIRRNLEDAHHFALARSVADLELLVEELREQQDGVTRHLLIQDIVLESLRKVTSRLEALGATWAEQLSAAFGSTVSWNGSGDPSFVKHVKSQT